MVSYYRISVYCIALIARRIPLLESCRTADGVEHSQDVNECSPSCYSMHIFMNVFLFIYFSHHNGIFNLDTYNKSYWSNYFVIVRNAVLLLCVAGRFLTRFSTIKRECHIHGITRRTLCERQKQYCSTRKKSTTNSSISSLARTFLIVYDPWKKMFNEWNTIGMPLHQGRKSWSMNFRPRWMAIEDRHGQLNEPFSFIGQHEVKKCTCGNKK